MNMLLTGFLITKGTLLPPSTSVSHACFISKLTPCSDLLHGIQGARACTRAHAHTHTPYHYHYNKVVYQWDTFLSISELSFFPSEFSFYTFHLVYIIQREISYIKTNSKMTALWIHQRRQSYFWWHMQPTSSHRDEIDFNFCVMNEC